MAGRQGREELIKQGLLEMMEQGKWAPRMVADLSGVSGAERTPGGVCPVSWRSELMKSLGGRKRVPCGQVGAVLQFSKSGAMV